MYSEREKEREGPPQAGASTGGQSVMVDGNRTQQGGRPGKRWWTL